MNAETAVKTEQPLVVTDVSTLKAENVVVNNKDFAGIDTDPKDPVLEKQADDFLKKLFNTADTDVQRQSIDSIGEETQKLAGKSEMLNEQIRTFANKGADGGEVAKSLLDLKNTVEALDPNKFDFDNPKNFFIRALHVLPFVGKPLKQYFEKYMTSQEVINAIITSLTHGRETLIRDNKILSSSVQTRSWCK